MNKEAQITEIANACGCERGYNEKGKTMLYTHPQDSSQIYWRSDMSRFDPLNDLNAMHEAAFCLTHIQQMDYSNHLISVVGKHHKCWSSMSMTENNFFTQNATASQRAEAFLKTIGKWTATDSSDFQPKSRPTEREE